MKDLTERQRRILDFIRESVVANQRPPTLYEMMEQFHIGNANGVIGHLKALEQKGFLERVPNHPNRIRLKGVRVVLVDEAEEVAA